MAGPIRLKTHRVLIDAPREQVFDEMSSVDGSGLQWDFESRRTGRQRHYHRVQH